MTGVAVVRARLFSPRAIILTAVCIILSTYAATTLALVQTLMASGGSPHGSQRNYAQLYRLSSQLIDTRSKLIQIAGKTVQLPPDAYIQTVVKQVFCSATDDPCPEQWLEIRRGSSVITVGASSGQIRREVVGSYPPAPFDFLKEALR